MTAHHIRYELDSDGIATLTIDRPEKRGAMTYAMLMEFTEKVAAIADDDRVRVLIVTGSGGSFCAGTDLADLATVPGETRGVRGSRHEVGKWWPLVQCPVPVIGAIGDEVTVAFELETFFSPGVLQRRLEPGRDHLHAVRIEVVAKIALEVFRVAFASGAG
mgnify:CR=1 FL=1